MAIRTIRKIGDYILNKKAKPVEIFDNRLNQLIDDMVETMRASNGLGLAAPQVGVLKRVAVIEKEGDIIVLVNPEIVEQSGSIIALEGCLSVPQKWGEVDRPQKVKVKALNRHGKPIVIEGEDMTARAFCHEIEHLDGKLFVERVIRYVDDIDNEEEEV